MADGKGNLYVSKTQEPLYIAHYLTTYFDKVIVKLAEVVGGDFLDEKQYGELLVGFLSLENLSGNHFNTAYQLTKIACQENSILAMYWQQIDKLFQSDPRFNP